MARKALGPATLSLVQAVSSSVVDTDRSLLVACSGGPDSLALSVAAAQVGRRLSLPVAAVVVDHRLQEGSSLRAREAAAVVRSLGVADVVVRAVSVDPARGGPEAAAREARYRVLAEEATLRAATVLLGHTRDDQAETVLLGLARGSGVRSLAGMAKRSCPSGDLRGRWLRPLLGVPRSVTEEACRENGLEPWQDPHNLDPSFARVRVRRTVLPVLETELGPGIVEALARTAALARDDADLLDELAAEADPGTASLVCTQVAALPPALRRRVLARWLRLRHGLGDLSAGHLLAVDALLTHWRGQVGVDLPGGMRVRRVGGQLVVKRPDLPSPELPLP